MVAIVFHLIDTYQQLKVIKSPRFLTFFVIFRRLRLCSDVIADQPRPVQACALRPMQLESPPRKVSATTAERVIKV